MTGGTLAPRLLGDASIGWHIRNGELMLRVALDHAHRSILGHHERAAVVRVGMAL